MASDTPTKGQLERSLSQKVQALYRNELGQQPSKVTCQLCGEKFIIILEDSLTQPEQVLAQEGQGDLAEEVRTNLDDFMKPQLKSLVEEVAGVNVTELLSDVTLESGLTGIIAVLEETPNVRTSNAS
ncbi:DUF2294 domain-containing protein [Acaryochloris sp. CCMEE 5410]|uniref:DUF2294 domain-containing protein n=1 Tax=Acaryochloris sp. CCMEE 5410 TaxID=310037 RepID=UPI0002484DF8|nr:DUF2294 domain-containing protein [Acaryochloris sp. CCMEE 5410]KAI9131983.1 DUF2294 domain-containing protein [Acaryochloris sp. CCMEE 5410]